MFWGAPSVRERPFYWHGTAVRNTNRGIPMLSFGESLYLCGGFYIIPDMEKNDFTTLVSCRLDNKTLAAIDKFCALHRFWNRSRVINFVLARMIRDKDSWSIYRFLNDTRPSDVR